MACAGVEAGLPLAERLNLAAQFVVEQPNGNLQVQQSSAWNQKDSAAHPPPSTRN